MLKLVVALLFVGVVAAKLSPEQLQFTEFVKKYNKVYDEKEFHFRFSVFQQTLARNAKLNANKQDGAVYGINEFADMSEEEFQNVMLMKTHMTQQLKVDTVIPPTESMPAEFDWRTKGAVTEVKNQGQCGSCWSFSTTGNLEGQWFIKHGNLTSLSEQNLVDCDKVDQACNGGLPSNAYQFLEKEGGIDTEAEYPYISGDGQSEQCKYNAATKAAATVSGWTALPKNEDQLAAWLAKNGPISIAINAGWMQTYSSGIANPWFCNPKELDHAVLLVGYGTENGKPFWIIKNSWGAAWGEQGYCRIIRGKGKCGLNTVATSAKVPDSTTPARK
eukprot:TRINITY_DN112_c0_g1_i1.p1 TRINITY_DN112_c0_g1~~TRINITY_DN112_c0_g1_i1.p1  ORF type:complete len:331 (+),score=118.58 TRINITY_DN112_c0_g1_i1:115-1107(+)